MPVDFDQEIAYSPSIMEPISASFAQVSIDTLTGRQGPWGLSTAWFLPSLRSISHIVLSVIVAGFVLYGGFALYRRHFDRLSKFPGPFLASFSNIPYTRSYLGGRQPWEILRLHEKYGPVVRISPTELSFNSAQSWHDIYGIRKGHETFIKSSFYDGGNFADQAHSIVSERNPSKHAEMRKFLSRAFSDKSLKEQEHLVSTIVDTFVERLADLGSERHGVDLTKAFNLLTFDIIGELAFGKSFKGVETGETHFWINIVLESMGQASLFDTMARFPWLAKAYLCLRPGWLANLMAGAAKHQQYTIDLTMQRISERTERRDFMSYLLQNRAGISDIQLAAHASDFVIAGSETTATTLATIFYYLCIDESIKNRLYEEVDSQYSDYAQIDGSSAASLKFLHAICLEALRMFPPLPLGLPRLVPGGGDTVDGNFVPSGAQTIVSTNPIAASMSRSNFQDPEHFRPERWLGMNESDALEASQPFSYGPRACLGRSLAWLELNTTIAKLIFKYDFELTERAVDWQRDTEMHLLWKKPALRVSVKLRRTI